MHKITGSDTSYTLPMSIDEVQIIYKNILNTTFESLIQEWIRYTAVSSTDGYSLSYNIGTSVVMVIQEVQVLQIQD